MTPSKLRRISYATTELKAIEFRLKDVEEIPEGFTRDNRIISPEDLYRNYRFMFADLATERFIVFLLNSSNKVQAIRIVSEGILNSALVHPREVFQAAIVGSCASIILAHNHPSGNQEPSGEDIQVTKQMVEAGKILGILVQDHVIFTQTSFTSLAERGVI